MSLFGDEGVTAGPVLQQSQATRGTNVAGGAGVIGGIISAVAQPFMQKWQQDFERHEAGQAYERNIELWNMQNEYNHPKQMMQRFKEAGLNPNLVYGKGTATQASPIAPYQKAKSISRELTPVNPTSFLDVLGKYHGVRMANEQANVASWVNRAEASKAYVTWMDTWNALDRLKSQTTDADQKAKISKAQATIQNEMSKWAQEGFTSADPVGARRVISAYSGDSKYQDLLLNAISGARTVQQVMPNFGLGFLKGSIKKARQ